MLVSLEKTGATKNCKFACSDVTDTASLFRLALLTATKVEVLTLPSHRLAIKQ